jgi:REP element-mobilizing transposase RayT
MHLKFIAGNIPIVHSKNKKYNPDIHHRKSIRLKGYDYAQTGLYFITICCYEKRPLFGEIVGAKNLSPAKNGGSSQTQYISSAPKDFSPIDEPKMILNDAGIFANDCWLGIPKHFPNVVLHEYIIMPNHIHGIIQLVNDLNSNGTKYISSNTKIISNGNGANGDGANGDGANGDGANGNGANGDSPLRSPFNTIGSVVRGFKIGVTKWMRQNTDMQHVWQRNYYECIIRDERSYHRISEYIINNPAKWAADKFYKKSK